MEIIVAILWYLNLLIPGQSYTLADIDAMAIQNQAIIQNVQSNPVSTDAAIQSFNEGWDNGTTTNLIEIWEENPMKPIHD